MGLEACSENSFGESCHCVMYSTSNLQVKVALIQKITWRIEREFIKGQRYWYRIDPEKGKR